MPSTDKVSDYGMLLHLLRLGFLFRIWRKLHLNVDRFFQYFKIFPNAIAIHRVANQLVNIMLRKARIPHLILKSYDQFMKLYKVCFRDVVVEIFLEK